MTREFWANLALCAFLGTVAIFSITQAGSALTPKGLFVTTPQPSAEAEKIFDDVVLTKYQIGEDLKNMVEADFYIKNKSAKNIRNVNILCEFYDENNTYRDRHEWILAEIIPAMHDVKISTVSRRYVNTGARALTCAITDFELVARPAFALDRHVSEGHGETSGSGHGSEAPAGH